MAYSDNSIFMKSIKPNVPRSLFDLSHVVDTTLEMGALVPIYLQDCVPNDTFTISNDVLVRAMPMVVPLLSRIKVYTAYYFVPYSMLWKNFENAISGGRLGTYEANFPQFKPSDWDSQKGNASLWNYFGFDLSNKPADDDLPSAFPFAAYQRIYRDYYLYFDIQDSGAAQTWDLDTNVIDFVLDDGFNSRYGTKTVDGSNVRPELGVLRYRDLKRDYFTSAKPSPQRGVAPSLPLSGTGIVDGSASRFSRNADFLQVYSTIGNTNASPGDSVYLGTWYADRQSLAGSTRPLYAFKSDTALATPDSDIQSGDFGKVSLQLRQDIPALRSAGSVDFSQAGTFTVDDLRLITQLQLWLERNMRSEAVYKDFLRAHFDSAPIDERLTKPAYIGGTVQSIVVSEVLQQSESTSTSPQGQMTGHGISRQDNFVGKWHCKEFGLIMGLMSIMPDTLYSQGQAREWSKKSRFDYYFPEFANLSPQAILNKELYVSGDTALDNGVYGYQERCSEMRYRHNYITGALRDFTDLYWSAWTQARHFNETPTLSQSFVNSAGNIRKDFLAVPTEIPFVAEVANIVRAVRPLPYMANPMGL